MKVRRIILLACGSLAFTLTSIFGMPLAWAALNAWSVDYSPSTAVSNYLLSVAAPATGNAVTVGTQSTTSGLRTLIEHLVVVQDPEWEIVSSPNGSGDNLLNGVAASGSTYWAVGYQNGLSIVGIPGQDPLVIGGQTLIERSTDGGVTWSIIPNTPSPGSGANVLTGVTAASSTDIWASGYYNNTGGPNQLLLLHSTNGGTTWTQYNFQSPPGDSNILNSISAVSTSYIWAVGYYQVGTVKNTLILRWNGSSWIVVPSPNAGSVENILYGVSSVNSSYAWAVGAYSNGSTRQTLTERWNGSAWIIVASPNRGTNVTNRLYSVSANSVAGAWAVGKSDNPNATLTEFWNGSVWAIVDSPSPGASNILRGVAITAGTSSPDTWAVGNYGDGVNPLLTLIEVYSINAGSRTP